MVALLFIAHHSCCAGKGVGGKETPCTPDTPISELLRKAQPPARPDASDYARMITCLSIAVSKGKTAGPESDAFLHTAYSNLALAYFETQRFEDAENTLRAREQAGIALDADGHMMLCAIVERRSMGNWAKVAACYKRAAKSGVKPALAFVGQALQKQNDFEGAAKYYQKAVKAQPADGNLRKNYGAVLRRLGENAAALRQYEYVVEKNSLDVAGWMGLGKSWFDAGAPLKARDAFESALRTCGVSPSPKRYLPPITTTYCCCCCYYYYYCSY